jgi:hypothetical protein
MNIDEAVVQLAKAKQLETQAETFRQEARAYILDFFLHNPTEFRPDPASKTGGTVLITRAGVTASVTIPMSQEVPAHFDQAKASEFRAKIVDFYGEKIAATYFDVVYTLREQRYFDDMKGENGYPVDDRAARKELIDPFMVPKKEKTPMAPRVAAS